ncbi:hypothetical protein tb265_46510 [Gemmatimonadetes bacterium T265]|nr:hypothetical protein tb265_46510 [Gemmatimonadetes bacterium T265]
MTGTDTGTYHALVQRLVALAAPWNSAYSDSKVIAVAVVFAHVAGLVIAGGFAVAADRSTFRAWRAGGGDAGLAARSHHLAELRAVHRPVVVGLVIVNVSGVLLFLADVKTYAASVAFGVKLLLVALLLVNGLWMTRAEEQLRADNASAPAVGPRGGRPQADRTWHRLRVAAAASAVLWVATTFVGVVLSNG